MIYFEGKTGRRAELMDCQSDLSVWVWEGNVPSHTVCKNLLNYLKAI